MNDKPNSEGGPLRPRDDLEFRTNGTAGGEPRRNGQANGHAAAAPPVSFWTFADLLANHWHWLVVGIIIGCGGFFVLGWKFVQPKFTATAQLLRYETPGQSD